MKIIRTTHSNQGEPCPICTETKYALVEFIITEQQGEFIACHSCFRALSLEAGGTEQWQSGVLARIDFVGGK